jgi:hypothetical protein
MAELIHPEGNPYCPMATSKTRRAPRATASRSKPAAKQRRTPAKRRPAAKQAKRTPAKRAPVKTDVSGAATAVLKSFVKLLKSLRSSAAHLSAAQRIKLQRAMKHAHAALD